MNGGGWGVLHEESAKKGCSYLELQLAVTSPCLSLAIQSSLHHIINLDGIYVAVAQVMRTGGGWGLGTVEGGGQIGVLQNPAQAGEEDDATDATNYSTAQ